MVEVALIVFTSMLYALGRRKSPQPLTPHQKNNLLIHIGTLESELKFYEQKEMYNICIKIRDEINSAKLLLNRDDAGTAPQN